MIRRVFFCVEACETVAVETAVARLRRCLGEPAQPAGEIDDARREAFAAARCRCRAGAVVPAGEWDRVRATLGGDADSLGEPLVPPSLHARIAESAGHRTALGRLLLAADGASVYQFSVGEDDPWAAEPEDEPWPT